MKTQKSKIKNLLERLYFKYNRREFIDTDPEGSLYRYSNPADIEIAALLSAALAYGRVEHIRKSLGNLFERMGQSPFDFVISFKEKHRLKLEDFRHRFTTGCHISDLLLLLRKILERNGSIEKFFARGYSADDKNILPALSNFSDSLLDMYAQTCNAHIPKGLRYLLAGPAGGSPCKRLNLFLRWMVRDDEVDLGLWKSIDKATLIVPVDTHMARLCRILGFYSSKSVSLATAIKITNSFAEIQPTDPVKYDFALSRLGIVEKCTGKWHSRCRHCELAEFCSTLHKK